MCFLLYAFSAGAVKMNEQQTLSGAVTRYSWRTKADKEYACLPTDVLALARAWALEPCTQIM